ncbi:hypothetical protein O3M35_009324 [Rhynocoris fuscipes]|uniref:Uncharacterized protein n=1 Tax=Rhynocoris fuscipes TaxID=488301 RepID=A0AAW1D8H1_9HEMI
MIHVYSAVTYISGILYYVSTTINPILYHIMSLKFREAFKDTVSKCCWPKRKSRPYLILSRGRIDPESGRSLTDSSAQQSSLNQHQLLRKQNSINQQRTSPISSMDTNSTQLPPICTRCQNQYNNQKNSSSMLILNDSGDISNSSLHDVDRAALEDELTAYMNELARRQLS